MHGKNSIKIFIFPCQGKRTWIFTRNRTPSFQRQLEIWKRCVEIRQCECFRSLNDFVIETESNLAETVYRSIVLTFKWFATAFQKYCYRRSYLGPKSILFFRDEATWVRNPYCFSEEPEGMSVQNYECLTAITSDTSLKQKFIEFLWSISGAVFFKNIRKCRNAQYSDSFRFLRPICVKVRSQGMRQQNLNIVTYYVAPDMTILHSSSL